MYYLYRLIQNITEITIKGVININFDDDDLYDILKQLITIHYLII